MQNFDLRMLAQSRSMKYKQRNSWGAIANLLQKRHGFIFLFAMSIVSKQVD